MAAQSPCIYRLRTAHGEGFLEWSQTGRQNGRSRLFMSVTLQPAVHLGNDNAENLHSIKHQPKRTLKQLFTVTEKLVRDQKGISGIPVINWQQLVWQDNLAYWQGSSICDCKNIRLARFSTVCGRNQFKSRQIMEGEEWLRQDKELDRIDGEPMEFEWKFFPGFTTLQILAEIQNMMTEIKCEPEQFQGRIIFMSVLQEKKETEKPVLRTLLLLQIMLEKFAHGQWSLLGSEKKWYGTHVYKPNGQWDDVADVVMINFCECGHLVFRGSSAFERGDLKSKGKGHMSIHFNGSDETVEVILRTVISVNQLSVYGAVADMCEELAWEISKCSKGTEKPVALDNLETMVMPPELSTTDQISPTDGRVQNLLREYEQKFANLPEHLQLIKICSSAGLAKTVEKGQYFTTLDDTELDRLKGSCREYTLPRSDQSSQVKGWIRGNTEIIPVLYVMVCYHQGRYGVAIMIESLVGDKTCSWVRIVSGISKYVTATSEENHVESIVEKSPGKFSSKARPRQTSNSMLSPVPIPCRERNWIDVESGSCDQSCLEVLKLIDDQIAATWGFNKSRRRRSSKIRRSGINISIKNLRHLRTGQFEHGLVSGKEEVELRRDSSIAWITVHLKFFCTFEQFKAVLGENTLILHCKTTCSYPATSPSTSITLEVPMTYTPSSSLDWFLVENCQERDACGVLHGRRCSSISIKKSSTTWRSPEL